MTQTTPLTATEGARRSDLRAAWRTALPAVLAMMSLGIAFGVLVSQSPLDWWWGPVFAAFIFAGSLEFLLIGMIAAVAPLSQIAVTALLVNFRHVFYALSFPLHRIPGAAGKAYSTFALTDESFALTATPDAQRWSRSRILWLQASMHIAWVVSVAAGSLGGALIPPQVVGIEFVVTAFFLVLAIDAYRLRRSLPLPLVAVAVALLSTVLFGESMLLAAMVTFAAIISGSYAFSKRSVPHA